MELENNDIVLKPAFLLDHCEDNVNMVGVCLCLCVCVCVCEG